MLLAKGVLNPEDAATGVKAGVAGIIVSPRGAQSGYGAGHHRRAAAGGGKGGRTGPGSGGWRHPARHGHHQGAGAWGYGRQIGRPTCTAWGSRVADGDTGR